MPIAIHFSTSTIDNCNGGPNGLLAHPPDGRRGLGLVHAKDIPASANPNAAALSKRLTFKSDRVGYGSNVRPGWFRRWLDPRWYQYLGATYPDRVAVVDPR